MHTPPPPPPTTPKVFYFEHPHPVLIEILWGWALNTILGLGTRGRFWGFGAGNTGHWGWASGVGHWRLWVGHTLGLGRLWGWASGVLWGADLARRRVPGKEKSLGGGEELRLKSNNPTPRVWKKKN